MAYTMQDFYVGQRVRVRSLEDMSGEFEHFNDGVAIRHPDEDICFNIKEMTPLCGMTAVIQGFEEVSIFQTCRVMLDDWRDLAGIPTSQQKETGGQWAWTCAMLEPAEDVRELGTNFTSELFAQMIGVTE